MKILYYIPALLIFLWVSGCDKKVKIRGSDYMAMSSALSEVNMFFGEFNKWPSEDDELHFIRHYRIYYVNDYRDGGTVRPIIIDEAIDVKNNTVAFMCSEGTFLVLKENLSNSIKKVEKGDFLNLQNFQIDPETRDK